MNAFANCTGPGNILTVADDLLKNDGQKFLEMMEQLAERRMLREEEAAADIEEDSEEEEEDEEDEDIDEDEEDDEEDEVSPSMISICYIFTAACPFKDHDGGAENGGGQEDVLHLCRTHVRTTCSSSLSRKSCTGTSAAAASRT